jgi:hypothetical protein
MRGSFGLEGCSDVIISLWGLAFLTAARSLSDNSCVDLIVGVASGDGLSSLLGGVLKGETFASMLAFRPCCCGTSPTRSCATSGAGFAGIFGLSARLTGGGIAVDFNVTVSSLDIMWSTWPWLGVESPAVWGVPGRVDARLECCEIRSRTFATTRSGDGVLVEKYPFGGDRGESIVTDGVNCGEPCICIDIGRL